MSELERMIAELCPDGVEYFPLHIIADIPVKRIDVKKIDEHNYVGVDNLLPDKKGKVDSSYVPKEGSLIEYVKNDILIGNIRPYLKKIWLATDCGGTNGDVIVIRIKHGFQIDAKYLYYVLSSDEFFLYDMQNAKGAKMPRGDKTMIMKYPVPVPPLPIQREIVRILDKFTELTAELTEKLTAELTERRKQFDYYRSHLLFSSNGYMNCYLPDISENCDSKRKPITGSVRKAGIYPYYGASGIVDYVDNYIFDGDYLLISEDGANLLARSTPIAFSISGKNWVNNHAHILKFDNYYTRKYVEYYVNATDLTAYITGGAQPKLNQQNLNKLGIPLPPLHEQERIVSILDRFDALCNDITQGLPAEIKARQKQYEYYRDKLLTFKEKTIESELKS